MKDVQTCAVKHVLAYPMLVRELMGHVRMAVILATLVQSVTSVSYLTICHICHNATHALMPYHTGALD